MSADQAKPGEVWLSSQNRNFENRMGKGKPVINRFRFKLQSGI
jgi:homoaconitase/3-isopropylmalate dehydratase large subunit